jgi:hypothetical protein
MAGGSPTWTARLEPPFNFYASPRVSSLLCGARRPALLADASLWWPEVTRSAGRSHIAEHGRAEDYLVAKEMYSRVLSAKSQFSEIVFCCTA